MCFYDQFEYQCKCFRWGNFRQHCTKDFRRGETCGMKLVYEVIEKPELCSICERLGREWRRYHSLQEKLKKWDAMDQFNYPQLPRKDLKARRAAITDEIAEVKLVIVRLHMDRQSRAQQIGGNRRAGPSSYSKLDETMGVIYWNSKRVGSYGNALQAAAASGHREIVQLLLDSGADVHAKGGYYNTAARAAAARGHFDIAQLLEGHATRDV